MNEPTIEECVAFVREAWLADGRPAEDWEVDGNDIAIARHALRLDIEVERWRHAINFMEQYNGRSVAECLRLADEYMQG
jgi:hypothetical protein